MTNWIIFTCAVFNFSYGVLLPIIPRLGPETAGVAFAAFALFKIVGFAPGGALGDRIGHLRAYALAYVVQIAALAVIAAFPERAWLGRVLEGLAIGSGTVTSISLLRLASGDAEAFARSIRRLMGWNGAGFLVGPLVGYLLLSSPLRQPVWLLVALNGALLVAHLALFGAGADRRLATAAPRADTTDELSAAGEAPRGELIRTVAGFAAVKGLALGWQPNVAWWAPESLHLGPTASGITFMALGIGFTLGAWRRGFGLKRNGRLLLGLAGLVALEAALSGRADWAWWIFSSLMGLWFGSYATAAVARLGWNQPERVGRFNSAWMIATELPVAIVPLFLWEWRQPAHVSARAALALVFLALAWLGDERAPAVTAARGHFAHQA